MLCRLVFPAVLWISMTDGLLSNLTNIARTLPEIHGDEKCVPGHKYLMDCNTCFCINDGSLMCTKVLCLPPKDSRRKNVEVTTLNMKKKPTPTIPNLSKKNCVPGKIYRKGCQMCFCEDNKRAVCTKDKNACKRLTAQDFKIYQLEDIRPRFLPEDVEKLPKLLRRRDKCEPGKSYKVDCNVCVCRASHNLICDELICMSYDDMHRIIANEKSKGSCKPHSYRKTKKHCIECDCVKGKVKCNEIVGCISEKDKKLPNWNNGKPKLSLATLETCIPGGVYKKDCNNCYCQHDSSLRCTLKLCPNYTQFKALEEIRSLLTEHGLF